jgi:tripartite-type tricarboxylate transporter receptor subunit TctC
VGERPLCLHFCEKPEIEMVMHSRRNVVQYAIALAGLGLMRPMQAVAQAFPSRPIRIIVPTAAGTPPDILSHFVATELSEGKGWQVVVEDRPGALQTIGMSDVLKRPADGYSIFAMSLGVMATPALMPNLGVHLETDFAPVIKVSTSSNVLVVNPSVPAKSISELVALLKREPDKLTFSSNGFGTPSHLIGEMFKLQAGVRATHVPYQQLPQAIGDLLAGTNQYMFVTMLPVIDLVNSGKLRALAVTGPKRVPAMKDIPTVAEEGFPNLVVEDFVGFAVKSGTPDQVVAMLNRAIDEALADAKIRESFARLGAVPAGGTPAEFGDFVKSQIAIWNKVVGDSGIKLPQ